MGCCGSTPEEGGDRKTSTRASPGGGGPGYDDRREKMLAAAEQREKENAMRGVKTQKAAGKLKAEMTSRNQPHASSNKPDLAKDW
eukprot:CAMPEP_0114248858 /NCGR_PEP_ID=MMETSP0058-20121206/13807_1 /TAXON_ID=36894 /ORGANISM="Pyramimonas parkeae, CCMP726" /LENGTH=84 /DNA_ID=CAMNT_0001362313 /DNA_START=195 /DNA_END=446 /DNA_ORIENTATION=+